MEAQQDWSPRAFVLVISANLVGGSAHAAAEGVSEPSLVAALPPTGVNQSWQQCEWMHYSSRATPSDFRSRKQKSARGRTRKVSVSLSM
jgi:hypothetical protein